jgi:hypothetical protein
MAATQQGWDDWGALVEVIRGLQNSLAAHGVVTTRLDQLKSTILDVPTRKNAMNPVANAHPTYTVSWIEDKVAALRALRDYLVAQGWIT